jgi:heptosyltransferase III
MTPMRLPSSPRILVVALRRLGDVLLTTPLIRSVKCAFPDAAIDALVFAGTEGVLAGNPDLKNVLTIPPHPGLGVTLALLRRIAKSYDLALSTQTGDRPTALAAVAGRQSVGLLEAEGLAAATKRVLLSRSCITAHEQHRVCDILQLAGLVGVPAHAEVVCPAGASRPDIVTAKSYAVVHAAPMFVYKRWTPDGWSQLAAALRERGLGIVVTGAAADRTYLDDIWQSDDRGSDVIRLDGKLGWPDLAAVIGAARAYIGPDTAITHLAAATGVPTARQCLARAKPALMRAVSAGRLRPPPRQPQPMSRRTDGDAGGIRRRRGARYAAGCVTRRSAAPEFCVSLATPARVS